MKHSKGIRLIVNGRDRDVSAPPNETLLETLRGLGCFEVKSGCEKGDCGACAVLVDGEPMLSCLMLGLDCEGREITTVEGLMRDNELDPLQSAFADLGGAQCGYCTPGILVTAKALLERVRNPTREQIREALSGNLCRCTGYLQIFESVEEALSRRRRSETSEVGS